MELFQKFKNDFYRAVQRVARYVKEHNIAPADINSISDDVFQELMHDLLLDFDKNYDLKNEVLYAVRRLYEPKKSNFISRFVPADVQLLTFEKQFLSRMLSSETGELFSEQALRNTLCAAYENTEFTGESFIAEDSGWQEVFRARKEKIAAIIQAVDQNVWLQDVQGNRFLPYKIRYSLRWKTFELLAQTEDNTAILRNLDEFSDFVLTDCEVQNRTPLKNLAEALLAEETVVLEVNHHRTDILDRCFALLRQHERLGSLTNQTGKGKDVFRFEIRYLKQEEDQLIQDILSLSDAVVVKSPERIRNIVIEEWKKIASYYQ